MSLATEIKGAKIVMKDPKRGVTMAWFGGHGVHAYNKSGGEIGFWNVGDFSKQDASPEEVRRSMRQRKRTGEYE